MVEARTAQVRYNQTESERIESKYDVTDDMISKSTIGNRTSERPVHRPEPSKNGRWVEKHKIRRREVPVRRVRYKFDGDSYQVLDVNGDIHTESTPSSVKLSKAQRAARKQREQLRAEYDDRERQLTKALQKRQNALTEAWEARQAAYAFTSKARIPLIVLAVTGAYMYITML